MAAAVAMALAAAAVDPVVVRAVSVSTSEDGS
jgi:hypothetical protein